LIVVDTIDCIKKTINDVIGLIIGKFVRGRGHGALGRPPEIPKFLVSCSKLPVACLTRVHGLIDASDGQPDDTR